MSGMKISMFVAVALGGLAMLVRSARADTIYASSMGTHTIVTASATTGVVSNPSLITTPTGIAAHEMAIEGNYLFFGNDNTTGTVSEYTTSGSLISSSAVSIGSGGDINAVAVSGNDLFVANYSNGQIGEYSVGAAGALSTVNADLITVPVGGAWALAVSGSDLYVSDDSVSNTVYAYSLTTDALLAGFTTITGVTDPGGLAVANGNLYITGISGGTISAYSATTGLINSGFTAVTGLSSPSYLAINTTNGDLLVTNHGGTTVGEYNATNGNTVNASFISGLTAPYGLAVSVLPLPPTFWSLLFLLGLVAVIKKAKRIPHLPPSASL
jgi:6-phosphogluconolactonase (cycloisomerase 2 family)